jgi:methylisocitrate lyase
MFTTEELANAGVSLALYPLSAYRAMAKAAVGVYETLRRDGTQKALIDSMQTRDELYDVLGYHEYEDKLDQLFADKGLTKKKD